VQREARRERGARERPGALGALGVTDALKWHGQSSVHGRARVKPPRGIDPRCRGGYGGEVTVREVDGGVQTITPSIAGNGDVSGVGEAAQLVHCCAGSARV
jgi:hypothetical protein